MINREMQAPLQILTTDDRGVWEVAIDGDLN